MNYLQTSLTTLSQIPVSFVQNVCLFFMYPGGVVRPSTLVQKGFASQNAYISKERSFGELETRDDEGPSRVYVPA